MSSDGFATAAGLPFGKFVRASSLFLAGNDGSPESVPDVVALALFASLLCVCIVVGHLLEEYRWINESVTAILFVSQPALFLSVMSLLSRVLNGGTVSRT